MAATGNFKLRARHLMYALFGLVLVLGAVVVASLLGYRLEEKLLGEITNGVMILAVGILLYSRKLRADEAREAGKDVDAAGPADGSTGRIPDGDKGRDGD